MQKHVFEIEKLRKVTLYGVLLILVLILSLILLFQTSYIQTKISNYITKELSEKFNSEITINSVKISLFKGFVFNNIYIKDQQQDTLIYIDNLSIIPNGLQININNISLKEIRINEFYINLYKIGKDTLNIQYLLDALNNKKTDSLESFSLKSQHIFVANSRFRFIISDTLTKRKLNFKNLYVDSINISLKDFIVKNENYISEIKNISFKEKSGFNIKKLSSKELEISTTKLRLKHFNIETPISHLEFDSLKFNYPSNYDFSNFKSNLKSNISIKKKSYFSSGDIYFFIQDTTVYANKKANISGNIVGSYNNLNIDNLNISAKNIFKLKLQAKIKNLQYLENPEFFVKVEDFNVNVDNLQELPFIKNSDIINKIPKWAQKSINYNGISQGKFSHFTTKGFLFGDFGEVSLSANTKKDSTGNYNVKGDISATQLQISDIFNNKDIETISFNQNFNLHFLKNKKYRIETSGLISDFTYKKHLYQNIDFYAEINDKVIDSINVLINQPMISARVIGMVDFSKKTPNIKLFVNVANADISALNLINFKNTISGVNFIADANFKGSNLNDFKGFVKLVGPLKYKKDTSSFVINKFSLKSSEKNNKKTLSLLSDIVDAKIITSENPNETIKRFKSLSNNLLQSEKTNISKLDTTVNCGPIGFEANVKQADFLMSFFKPEYHISNNTKIYGFYDPRKNKVNLSLNSNFLKYKNVYISDFYLIAYTKNNKIYGGAGGSSLKPNPNIFVENINLEGDFSKDSINFNLNWNNYKDTANNAASILGKINIKKTENKKASYECKLNNSNVVINNVIWKLNDAKIVIDSSKVSVFDLILTNNKQTVYLDGNISEYPGDILFAEYKNFKISNIQPLIKNNLKLNGELNGNTTFAQLYDKPLIFTEDSIVNLKINKISFGNFYFKSNWDNVQDKIHVNAYNLKGKYKKFMNDTIYGDYWPNTGEINFITDVRSMLLKTFKDYYSEYAHFNSTAYIKGKVFLYGNYKKPKLKGNLKLKQANVLIKYLNTNYGIDDMNILFDSKNITIEKTKIHPSNKDGYAYLKGKIKHNLFSNYNLNIDIETENCQIMDIGQTENSYFYGTAYGTGNLNFSGPIKNLYLNANLKTEKETFIFFPMSSSEVLKDEQNFIRFVTDTTISQSVSKKEEYKADINGFTMKLIVDVTPEATMQIIPDENGDIITNGSGQIILNLDSESNFNMFGSYIISKGNYKINISQISKEFKIQNGSKIDWSGNPSDATIDIIATYSLSNITLNNLIPEETEQIEKSEVDCSISLNGTLLNPELKLFIVLPDNVSQKYKSKLESLEAKAVNEQFLSLLIMKRFFSSFGTDFADPKPLTGDLLTSQLNSVINKLSGGVDVSVIYQPGQETVTDEYGVVLSGSAFDNRLTYKGGLGIGGNEIEKKDESVVGEIEVEIKLNPKGTFKAKVYNKANDKFENDGTYTQGAGLIWRQKFDSFFWWVNKTKSDTIK